MVTSVSYEIDQKRKLVRTLGFFLDFSSQLILTTGSWDSLPVCLVTSGDHGDHGTSVSVGQWAYSDVSLNLTLCQWLTFWREICVISLRKVSWVVGGGGGIAIIESAPGPDLEIWNGDGIEMTCTWPDNDLDMVWTRAWQFYRTSGKTFYVCIPRSENIKMQIGLKLNLFNFHSSWPPMGPKLSGTLTSVNKLGRFSEKLSYWIPFYSLPLVWES